MISLVVFAAVVVAGRAIVGLTELGEGGEVVMWLAYGLGALLSAWVSKLAQGVVIVSAAMRMDGEDPTFGSVLRAVRGRLWRILGWAALTTVVSAVLERLRRIRVVGQLLAVLGSLAFNVVSFLALPVVVFEGAGPIEALKRSARLLKDTWGENLAFNFSLNALGALTALPAFAVGVAGVVTEQPAVIIFAVVVGGAWFVLVAGVFSALSAVFKTALYRWATGRSVDSVYDAGELDEAFRTRTTAGR